MARGHTKGPDEPEEATVYRDEFYRTWEGPFPFNLPTIQAHAPLEEGVYQVLYGDGDDALVAYIGIATGDTIRGRLSKHCSGSGNWALGQLGNPANFRFVYYECDDPETCKQIESHVLVTKKPPFNVKVEYKNFIQNITVH